MEELGIVRKKQDDIIFVEVRRASACGSHCSTCPAKCAESKSEILSFKNTINAHVGDVIKVKSNDRAVLTYIFLVYGLPLMVMIVAISLANYIFYQLGVEQKDLWSLIIGLISLVCSYLSIKKMDSKFARNSGSAITLEKLWDHYEQK